MSKVLNNLERVTIQRLEPESTSAFLQHVDEGRSPHGVPEFARLYHLVQALSRGDRSFVVQFIGSVPGEGVSTVAANFARVAASVHGVSSLLVDCHPQTDTRPGDGARGMPSLLDVVRGKSGIDAAIRPFAGFDGLSLAKLSNAPRPALDGQGSDMRQLLTLLKQVFPIVVLDCPAATVSPDGLAFARYCDGSILVVRAEKTKRRAVAATKQAIERFGGTVIGVAFNRRKTYVPSWLSRWA